MGAQEFNRWKLKTAHRIMELINYYERIHRDEVAKDLETLLAKLRTAKRRDMPTLLNEIWDIHRKHREDLIYKLIPNEAVLFNIMSGPEEDENEQSSEH